MRQAIIIGTFQQGAVYKNYSSSCMPGFEFLGPEIQQFYRHSFLKLKTENPCEGRSRAPPDFWTGNSPACTLGNASPVLSLLVSLRLFVLCVLLLLVQ